jgi:hypothetical protein
VAIYLSLPSLPAQACGGLTFTFYILSVWRRVPKSVETTVLRLSRVLKVVLLKTTMRHVIFCVMDVHDAVITVRIILIRAIRNHTYFVLVVK